MRRAALALAMVVAIAGGAARADDSLIVQPADRDVSPPGVMPVPSGPLVRETVPPKPPDPPRWRRYFLPQTPDAATFVVPGMTIHVSGVTAVPSTGTCAASDGSSWPCGETALFAFRRFLHGRAVECYFPAVAGAGEVTAPCRVGRQDIGLWLLQNGWAQASDLATDAYRLAAKAAACKALGIWRGSGAPADCAANASKS